MESVIKEKRVKIRRPHRCVMCGKDFPVGTEMQYQVQTLDRFQTVYTCLTCVSLAEHFDQSRWLDGFGENCTQEEMVDFSFKGTPEEYLELKRKERQNKLPQK